MAIPFRGMNRSKEHSATLFHISEAMQTSGSTIDILNDADIIIAQRNFFGSIVDRLKHFRDSKPVVGDFDDAFDLMHPTNASYSFWHEGVLKSKDGEKKITPTPLYQFKSALKEFDAITTPSRRLCSDWERFSRKAIYIPNYLDLYRYHPVQKQEKDYLVIGWGGSVGHLQSWRGSGSLQAVASVLRKRKNVKLMICGSDPRIVKAKELSSVNPSQIISQPFVPFQQWNTIIGQFDIGLAPLQGAYDQRRSWIKVMEYMALGVPWIASKSNPYQELAAYGSLVENMSVYWERRINDVIDDIGNQKLIARQAPMEFAHSMSIDRNIESITKIYQSLIDGRS